MYNDFIFQYMCEEQSPGIRDGTTTNTIPNDPIESQRIEYGQHETYLYYQKCSQRERNKGLFTADQLDPNNQGTNSAIFTRQNANGQRYGFECPEERDHYPYWHPSPWIDIAVMTTDLSRCAWYQNESFNVQPKSECSIPMYNNRADCINNMGEWTTVSPNGNPAPQCLPSCWTRDNYIGDTVGATPCSLNITLPSTPSKRCILRMRYNTSSADFDGWSVDYRNNTNPPGESPLVAGYYPSGSMTVLLTGNPQVDIGIGVPLQMNINTNQFFRVFQDRSHVFELRQRPSNLNGAHIQNLNVRGRRGNIVQVYPSVEYDFVPTFLVAQKNDYVHIQWTGSNNNAQGNDGQGNAGTDRNNFVLSRGYYSNYPIHLSNATLFDQATLTTLAVLNPGQFGGDTQELNDAGTYFDIGALQLNKPGVYTYISTRNNDFSNRDQKGVITVLDQTRSNPSASMTTVRNALIGTSAAIVGVVALAFVGVLLFVVLHPPTRKVIFGRCIKRDI